MKHITVLLLAVFLIPLAKMLMHSPYWVKQAADLVAGSKTLHLADDKQQMIQQTKQVNL